MYQAGKDKQIRDIASRIYEAYRHRVSADDEYADWADYRQELTDFVIRHIRPGASVIIFGAGKCNDLDLARLDSHAGSVTLSDFLPEAAEAAFARYHIQVDDTHEHGSVSVQSQAADICTHSRAACRWHVLCEDYVGISDETYIAWTAWLLEWLKGQEGNEKLSKEAKTELRERLQVIYDHNRGYQPSGDRLSAAATDRIGQELAVSGQYDTAIVVGVHSQLNNSFSGILDFMERAVRRHTDELTGAEEQELISLHISEVLLEALRREVSAVTREHTPDMVRRLNEMVFARAREGVIYGYEKYVLPDIQVTVDGAHQAGEEAAHFRASDSLHCVWPLSRKRGISFQMCIQYLEV